MRNATASKLFSAAGLAALLIVSPLLYRSASRKLSHCGRRAGR